MRENLIGYLLDALEPVEHAKVEAQVSHDPQLRRELEVLAGGLRILSADKAHHEPPVGLGTRTCEFVAVQGRVQPPPPVASVPSRWSMADMLVAAGIFLAASLLFWPAMNQSRFAARVLQCQDNLRNVGVALASYSNTYPRQFPSVALDDETNRAGIYAVILREHGLVPQTHVLICPSAPLADAADTYHVPTMQELMRARAQHLVKLQKQMGGSYGYSLGFFIDNRYHPPRDLRRATHAIMADAPHASTPKRFSLNHGGCGQNVLFEDLHVKFLSKCCRPGCNDEMYVNDDGQPHAGRHPDDVVLGGSDDIPVPDPQSVEVVEGFPVSVEPAR